MKQFIYINDNSISKLSFENNDIDTIDYSETMVDEGLSLTSNLEEFVYQHPEMLKTDVETVIVVNASSTFIVPGKVEADELEKLFSSLTGEETEVAATQWVVDELFDLTFAMRLDSSLVGFITRSFHPVEIRASVEVLLQNWQPLISASRKNSAQLIVVEDEQKFGFAMFDNAKLISSALINKSADDDRISEYLLFELLKRVTGENDNIDLYIDDSIISGSTVVNIIKNLEAILQSKILNKNKITRKFRSSFANYVYEMKQADMCIKYAIINNEDPGVEMGI